MPRADGGRKEWLEKLAPEIEAFSKGSVTRWQDTMEAWRDEPRGPIKYLGVLQGTRTPYWSVLVEVERFNSEDWEGPYEVHAPFNPPLAGTAAEWLLAVVVSRGLEQALTDFFATKARGIVGVRLAQPTQRTFSDERVAS